MPARFPLVQREIMHEFASISLTSPVQKFLASFEVRAGCSSVVVIVVKPWLLNTALARTHFFHALWRIHRSSPNCLQVPRNNAGLISSHNIGLGVCRDVGLGTGRNHWCWSFRRCRRYAFGSNSSFRSSGLGGLDSFGAIDVFLARHMDSKILGCESRDVTVLAKKLVASPSSSSGLLSCAQLGESLLHSRFRPPTPVLAPFRVPLPTAEVVHAAIGPSAFPTQPVLRLQPLPHGARSCFLRFAVRLQGGLAFDCPELSTPTFLLSALVGLCGELALFGRCVALVFARVSSLAGSVAGAGGGVSAGLSGLGRRGLARCVP
mmetsp:Transcript_45124/g.88573  ORF Transcript_45124/g.88573 Transcript_45124/m.88573 type:complete len:320 (+) Transcript_45124:1764-2723(+)